MTAKKRAAKVRIKKINGVPVHCKHDELVAVSKLKPNPDNPNEHPDEQIDLLIDIIRGNGWRDRITVSNQSGMIVKGHGRYQAAIRAGWTRAPVEYQDYRSYSDEVKDLIADNKIAELSLVDDKAARALIESLNDRTFNLRLAGFGEIFGEGDDADPDGSENGGQGKPEIQFSKEILLEHNYIVLYFDDPMDWRVAIDKFKLKKVRDLIPRKGQPVGVGRVLKGAEWLDRIK